MQDLLSCTTASQSVYIKSIFLTTQITLKMPKCHCIRWLNIISSIISGKEDAFQLKKEQNHQLIDDIEIIKNDEEKQS